MTQKQPNSRMCFICSVENPIGLKLSFYTDNEGRCIKAILDNCAAA